MQTTTTRRFLEPPSTSQPPSETAPTLPPLSPIRVRDEYSPLLKLGFQVIKWFFLMLFGFSTACILSSCLNAANVTATLQNLAALSFVPLTTLTFCIVASVVLAESLK